MERKIERNHLKLVPGLHLEENELGEFKMAADNVISIGIKRELVRFGMDSDWKR